MITIEVWSRDGRRVATFEDDQRIAIGRLAAADIQLPDEFVSAEHAVLYRQGGQLFMEATGTNPTWLDGARVVDGEPTLVRTGSVIAIRSFKLRVLDARLPASATEDVILQRVADMERDLYEQTFAGIDFRAIALLPDRVTKQGCDILRASFDQAYEGVRERTDGDDGMRGVVLSRLFQRLALRRLAGAAATGAPPEGAADGDLPLQVFLGDVDVLATLDGLLRTVRSAWEERTAAGRKVTVEEVLLEQWKGLECGLDRGLSQQKCRDLLREEFFRRIVNLAFALGPLEDLLDNPAATEILIVGPDRIYVEMGGRLRLTGDRFPSPQTTRRILERAVSREARRIDTSQPLVDAQLGDGSRLNAVIAPLSRSGDVLTIRKFRARPYTLEDLVENGSLSQALNRFLTAVVHARRNIVISGGTGSGKTTMLGALAAQVDPAERLVLVEDTAEIRLPGEMHVVCLQTRQANVEGKGEVTMRQLVRNALRMRPDRLIVGECRGVETIDMLQAMNTGHPGSFTTIHANSSREVVSRMEVMVLQGADLPLTAVRRQIASAVDVVVQVARVPGGSRRITEIAEVVGYDERFDRVEVVPIFQWQGAEARYRFTGWLPSFMPELEAHGRFAAEDCLAV